MDAEREPTSLEELLDRIGGVAADRDSVSLGMVMDAVGRRSFGPLLLVPGLVTLAPIIGDIPGVPTIMALIVLLTAGQLLFRRQSFWLPHRLLERSVSSDKLRRAMGWMRRPARFLDRLSRPRLEMFTQGAGAYAVAAACAVIALAMPVMEVVPFSANGAGLALTIFGLGLIARDGLFAVLALLVTAATLGAVVYGLL